MPDVSTTAALRDSTQVRGVEFPSRIFNQHPPGTGEFHNVIWVVVLFNVGDAILHGRKGASEDSDWFYLGVCQVTGVKVAGCHIGLVSQTVTKQGRLSHD